MDFDVIHINETDSTNRWLRQYLADGRDTGKSVAVYADYQSAGRGQGSNRWESAACQNLLFSMLLHPTHVSASRQFALSMAVSLAISQALQRYVGMPVMLKWPNDLYVGDRKLGGILIEQFLQGSSIKACIVGVGININQTVFLSDAPNPVSMQQLRPETGGYSPRMVLDAILREVGSVLDHWQPSLIRSQYLDRLYRREGLWPFRDSGGPFMASILTVADDGMLTLLDSEGQQRRYAFKEVQFVIDCDGLDHQQNERNQFQ